MYCESGEDPGFKDIDLKRRYHLMSLDLPMEDTNDDYVNVYVSLDDTRSKKIDDRMYSLL